MRLLIFAVLFLVPLFSIPSHALTRDIDVIISVDWEGEDLTDQNLEAMSAFRRDFPHIPLVQFLNAAYYTKAGADPEDTTERIRRGIGPCDEIGLHIHGWQDLMETAFRASGLTTSQFKKGPAFWHESSLPLGGRYGHDVPIKEYAEEELQAVIRLSRQTLLAHGFTQPILSFRAGGWMADDKVLRAVAREGFRVDSSAIAPTFLEARIGSSPLFSYVTELWGENGAHPTTEITPPDTILPGLVEVPGALFADYVTDNMAAALIEQLLQKSPLKRPILHLSFHQETAAQFMDVMRAILRRMNDSATRERGVRFHFRTLTSNTCTP